MCNFVHMLSYSEQEYRSCVQSMHTCTVYNCTCCTQPRRVGSFSGGASWFAWGAPYFFQTRKKNQIRKSLISLWWKMNKLISYVSVSQVGYDYYRVRYRYNRCRRTLKKSIDESRGASTLAGRVRPPCVPPTLRGWLYCLSTIHCYIDSTLY